MLHRERLALPRGIIDQRPSAFVPMISAPVAQGHPPPTATAHDNALKQGDPLAWRATALLGEVVDVVAQVLAVQEVLLVGDVGGIDPWHDDIPSFDRPPVIGDNGRVAWAHLLFASPIDEHAGIDRAGEYLLDHLIGRPNPGNASGLGARLDQTRHGETVLD